MSSTRYGCQHVPPRFADHFLDSFDPTVGKAAAAAKRAVEQVIAGDVPTLLLSGSVGCGKSHLAAAACHELADPLTQPAASAELALAAARAANPDGLTDPALRLELDRTMRRLTIRCPRWVSVPDVLARLRREIGNGPGDRDAAADVEDAAEAPGLVVLDDLGSEKASDWTAQVLFEIVGARYDAGLSLLVTSNLSARQLADAGYERIVSRLADGGALLEMPRAADYRQRRRRSVA